MERANKEIEVLRKQYEAMSQELKEATQEAEVAKCRRDWAFQERDKIVAERESIRSVCVCVCACSCMCVFQLLMELNGAHSAVYPTETLTSSCSFFITSSHHLFSLLSQDSV